jgi:hypothetical protein
VLRDETAAVLQFRDSALRRPIDVVAWMNTHAPREPESVDAHDNVIPLARFSHGSRHTWLSGPPGGEAA